MRYLGLVLAIALLGCAHSGTKYEAADGVDFSGFHRIGVPSFSDSTGRGAALADALSKGLLGQLNNETVNRQKLEQVLARYKVETQNGLGVEALEEIHNQTAVDAIIFGRMAPNWSAVRLSMVETETGTPVLTAVVKPADNKKTFTDPDEVAKAILRMFARLH